MPLNRRLFQAWAAMWISLNRCCPSLRVPGELWPWSMAPARFRWPCWLAGVQAGDEVITQPLSFVATANAIVHAGAEPVFVDVDRDTMGMSSAALQAWLKENVEVKTEKSQPQPFNKRTGRRMAAIVPMHTFGHPCRMVDIMDIARQWEIPVVEDAAEALGSRIGNQHCGTFGNLGIISFNGNKTITCGGGGAVLTNDVALADRARHLTIVFKIKIFNCKTNYIFLASNTETHSALLNSA